MTIYSLDELLFLFGTSLLFHKGSPITEVGSLSLLQCMNRKLPDVEAGFRKGRETRDQIANICWIIENTREFQKNIYFYFIDYAKAFDCGDHKKKTVENSERGGTNRSPDLPPEKSQEATVSSKLGK